MIQLTKKDKNNGVRRSSSNNEKNALLPRKVKAYIDLLRPFTLLAPFVGGVAGGLMGASYMDYRNFEISTLVYGAGTLVMVNSASNIINQVYDLEIDKINKPERPIPSGIISVDEATTVAWILYLIALFRAAVINPNFGFMVFLIMLFTLTYSMPPLRWKKRLWANNISIAIPRGLLGIVAAWSIFGPIDVPIPWAIGFVIFVYLIGGTTTKDLTDIKGDAAFGMRTLPVVYGTRMAVSLSAPFFILSFLFLAIEIMVGLLKPEAKYMILLIILSIVIIIMMLKEGTQRIPRFENSKVWVLYYIQLMTMQLWFAILYIKW